MKKRILFLAIMAVAIMTVFAMSVSAEEVLNEGNSLITSTSDEFATGENINYITGLANEIYFNGTSSQGNKVLSLEQRMVLKNDDGTYSTFPSAYLFNISKDGSKRAHRFQWLDITLINAATGQNYEPADLIRLEIPEGIIDIHHDDRSSNARLGMQNSTDLKAENLKYISFPASCTGTLTMGDFARGITALEEVDFSKMTNPHNFSMGTAFYGCTNLSKVTFPETFNSDNGSIGSCHIKEHMFRDCTSLTSIVLPKEINGIGKNAFQNSGLVSIDLSNYSIKTIQQDSFRDCKSLKTIKLPTVLTKIEAEAFRDCTALEFVDFGNNTATAFQFSAHRTFYNCGELRAISLPRNTQYINNGTFALCKKLEAFYLGEAIIQINGNKGDGAGDGPTFAECEKMYFVQEPFSITKADGSFCSVDEFEQPKKPSVYFFPSTLKRICGAHNVNGNFTMDENGHVKNVGAGDLAFVRCYNLNSYLVFPEGFTGVDESIRSGNNATENPDQRGDTLGTGLFHNCATKENPMTLVFMGQIHRLSFDRRHGQTSYMTYMFANSANTSFENTKIGTYIGDSYYSNQNEMYVVFCKAEGGAQRYKINFVGSDADKNVPVLTPTLVENGVTHVENPKLSVQKSPASCTDNAINSAFCFCGADMGEIESIGTALGHDHNIYVGIVYENYMADGYVGYKCVRCEDVNKDETVGAIFEYKGFSYTEAALGGTYSMAQFFGVNKASLAKYEEATGTTLTFGVIAMANKVNAGETAGTIKPSFDGGKVLYKDFTNDKHNYFEIKVSGISEELKDTKIAFCAYVIENGKMFYLNNGETVEELTGESYSDVVAIKNSK
ncbi:MAG: leucine-rich repeat domain-containing protein [Ruminococcaceae bacterium]|nr:leucine-rich repeat domain-containing protein [Oscillospiraceae bacterium]